MHKLDFRHIEVFQAVVMRGSASSAARALGISQPAVSKTIAQTEHLIGFSLFDRRQGKLVPTARALQLYEQTAQLFTTLDRVNAIVAKMAAGALAPVSLGAVPLLAMTLVPAVIPSTLIEHGFMVELVTNDSVTLTNRVAAGQLEFALISAAHDVEGVESVKLVESPTYCAVPLDHPLAGRDVIRIEDLHGQPFIGLSTSEELQTRLDMLFRTHAVRPSEVIRCPLMAAALIMAESGIGLTIVDSFAIRLASRQSLRFVPFLPQFTIEYRAIWPKGIVSKFGRRPLLGKCQQRATEMIEEASLTVKTR